MGKQSRRKRIAAMKREIRRVGGVVGVNPGLPEELSEQFLEMMFDCPDCAALGLRRPGVKPEQGHQSKQKQRRGTAAAVPAPWRSAIV